MVLTDRQVKAAQPKEKPYKLADSQGLFLYVSPAGGKSWRWKYRFAGKEGQKVLGRYPAMGLREARDARAALDKSRRSGINPALAPVALARTETFEEVARRWHEQQSARWRPGHAADVLRQMEADLFPALGARPIGDLGAPEVLAALRKVERRGAGDRAHRLRQRVDAIFALAIGEGLATSNPGSMLARTLAPVRTGRYPALRTLKDARALIAAVNDGPGYLVTKLASHFLAVTAARSEAVRHAEWSEIEPTQWRIPGAHMKGDRASRADPDFEFIVPLPAEAKAILDEVKPLTGNYPLIFGSLRDPRKPMSDMAISSLYKRLPEFAGRHVPHGWRSTFSTIMNEWALEHGKPGDREVIDLMLAHVRGGVEGIYNRAAHMGRRRELAEIWAGMLMGHAGIDPRQPHPPVP